MRLFHILGYWLLPTLLFGQFGRPTIVGQKPLSTNEDEPITILLTDLVVVDWDDVYPHGFTLTLYDGGRYSFSGHTVVPDENYYGELKVKVSVNDGRYESNKFDLKITVNAVNDPPVITSHKTFEILQGGNLTFQWSDFTVADPDNNYPKDFTLIVGEGSNYSVNGNTVTPHADFHGTLSVPITVNDGSANSQPVNVPVVVIPVNKRPSITGQEPLGTAINTPITIEFSHLKVNDPDNTYPDDFTMTLYPGPNYTYSGRIVTPSANYTGALYVPVTVHDGTSSSDPFSVRIDVSNVLHITGQFPLETDEDEPLTLQLSDLKVYDPENKYPSGFTLNVAPGNNYSVNGTTVHPKADYHGQLSVEVTVRNATATSKPFSALITVKPVNDAPVISSVPEAPLRYSIGNGPEYIFKEIEISDVDDEHLLLAEVGFRLETFQPGREELLVETAPGIRAVFDPVQGTLSLVGEATVAGYQTTLRSVQYNFIDIENPPPSSKTVFVKVNDGKAVSEPKERTIAFSDEIDLDIPTVFTPNSDAANDTWKIRPLRPGEWLNNAIIRVFNRRGMLVFETIGFDKEWDGRYNGEHLPADTYFYTIDMNVNFSVKKITGVVSIVR